MSGDRQAEVDRNFAAFESLLPTLIDARKGQFALMRGGAICRFLPDQTEALNAGRSAFPDGLFSIQEVSDRAADLGFFSHAVNSRIA